MAAEEGDNYIEIKIRQKEVSQLVRFNNCSSTCLFIAVSVEAVWSVSLEPSKHMSISS